jgi:hypothetical protein
LTPLSAKPFLIKRASPDGSPQKLPWVRYTIGLEFDQGRLFYGIRFDKANWHPGDNVTDAQWPDEAPVTFAGVLGTSSRVWSWWPWWEWAGPESEHELYPAIADGKMLAKLAPEITRLAKLLDHFCQLAGLPHHAATS